jgi:hypothetical protein
MIVWICPYKYGRKYLNEDDLEVGHYSSFRRGGEKWMVQRKDI